MNRPPTGRPTYAQVDLTNLAYNFNSSRDFIGKSLKYMAVVKADAYGHGAVECSKRLEAEGVDWFGVALPEEGIQLRESGIATPILCMGSFWAGQAESLLGHRLTPVIYQLDRAESLNRAAGSLNTIAIVHIKIDTGMGRVGVRFDELTAFADGLRDLTHIRVEGLMTHFASADDLQQNAFTDLQIQRFDAAIEIFRARGHDPLYLDMANSPGAVVHARSRGNMVRLGGILYGLGGDVLPVGVPAPELRPVMSLTTRVSSLKQLRAGETVGYGRTFTATRDSLIALLPIGYKDGYSRSLSNKANVIIRGTFAPVVGTISMDWTTIDVSNVRGVKEGDEVMLIGGSDGLEILAEDIAALLGTISYEVTCGIDKRVTKRFVR